MNHSFAHLSWATWANRSQSLICHERPERFAHCCSFVLSNLSESLTVAHLIWAMSKWANSQPWFQERSSLFFLNTSNEYCTQCTVLCVLYIIKYIRKILSNVKHFRWDCFNVDNNSLSYEHWTIWKPCKDRLAKKIFWQSIGQFFSLRSLHVIFLFFIE